MSKPVNDMASAAEFTDLAETVCRTENLTVAYRNRIALNSVTLSVPRGVVMGIVGPNGAGKSTLIQAMLQIVKPIAGTVEFFASQPLKEIRGRIGYMPQSTSVDWDFPCSALDVVTMGTYGSLGWCKRPGKRERARALASLEQLNLLHLAHRQIGQLSGGERQRVFLARTLVQNPDLLFMDEPLQGVDAKSEESIVEILHTLQKEQKTVLLVHHDLRTLTQYCDWVALINQRLIASGPVSQVFTEENLDRTYRADSLPSETEQQPVLRSLPNRWSQ